jgi:hypothetical protein
MHMPNYIKEVTMDEIYQQAKEILSQQKRSYEMGVY